MTTSIRCEADWNYKQNIQKTESKKNVDGQTGNIKQMFSCHKK